MPRYSLSTVPPGDPIRAASDGRLDVPDRPIIPFIEGDSTGPDIWRASRTVFDAAVAKAYGGKRRIAWMEVYAGEKAFNRFKAWLPEETVTAFKEFVVGIKGPLTTPVGGGIRSLNVTLRQVLDLYVCLRPVRYFAGVPSPVKRPELVDVVIFRENTEDIYAGIEWPAESPEARKAIAFLEGEMGVKKIRFPKTSGIGIKPISREGTERLAGAAVDYALRHGRRSVTFVHNGNINYQTGHAIFEATHGTAPKYANQDKVNPGSVILSGEMMLRHLGWNEAADAIVRGMEGAVAARTVTYDFHRLMEGATLVSCSGFAREIIKHM